MARPRKPARLRGLVFNTKDPVPLRDRVLFEYQSISCDIMSSSTRLAHFIWHVKDIALWFNLALSLSLGFTLA
jgi:hypothetical protein